MSGKDKVIDLQAKLNIRKNQEEKPFTLNTNETIIEELKKAFIENLEDATGAYTIIFKKDGTPISFFGGDVSVSEIVGGLEISKNDILNNTFSLPTSEAFFDYEDDDYED